MINFFPTGKFSKHVTEIRFPLHVPAPQAKYGRGVFACMLFHLFCFGWGGLLSYVYPYVNHFPSQTH